MDFGNYALNRREKGLVGNPFQNQWAANDIFFINKNKNKNSKKPFRFVGVVRT